jgi:hypothetical protein
MLGRAEQRGKHDELPGLVVETDHLIVGAEATAITFVGTQ